MFIVIQIRCGGKLLKKWFGASVSAHNTFLSVYNVFANGTLDKTNISIPHEYNTAECHVQVSKSDPFIEVQPDLEIDEVVQSLGIYVEFLVNPISDCVHENATQLANDDSDVFAMLMQASKNRDFLPQQQEVRNNKVRLRNDIIEYLINNRVGWSNDDVGSLGSQFVDSLTECLWYLDGGHNNLASRSLPVPVELSNFQGYNKPETHKDKRKAEKTLEQDFVSEHSLVLLQLTENHI